LLVGGIFGIATTQWPIFMPPQLDMIGLVFKIFGNPWAGYIGGFFLVVLGSIIIWVSLAASKK
jgi:hypothetical protein